MTVEGEIMRSMALVLSVVFLACSTPVAAQKDKKTKDAVVQGKAVAEWVTALEGKDVLARARAINALMQAGPEARRSAPALIALFADKDAGFLQPLAAVALSRMGADAVPPLQKALDDKAPGVRAGATLTLGMIGLAARAAVPALTKALKDPEAGVRESAAQALGRIGTVARTAGPALAEALGDREEAVRVESASALWRVSGEARGVGVLAKAVASENASLAQRAIGALGEMGPRAKDTEPALRSTLSSRDAAVRIAAAEALFLVTADIVATLPVVEAVANGKDDAARRAAVSALGILARDEKAVVALVRLLGDRNVDLRREAASALAERGVPTTPARKALEAGLTDGDASVRWWCALALTAGDGDTRKQEEEVLRAFRLALFRSGDELVGKAVTDVQAPGRAAPALAAVLKGRPVRLQLEAARALGQLGLDTRQAQDALVETMQTDDKPLRRAAAEALAALGVEAMPALVKQLGAADARLREGSARALGQMGVQARSALPGLTRLLTDAEAPVRTQAALAIWNIDGNAELALPVLSLVLKDVDNKDRWEAVEAIGVIAAEARPAIKGLTEVMVVALKDRDAKVRLQAARSLWRRTRDAKVVVPLLRDGVGDRDVVVRLITVETLGEMSREDRVVPLLVQALEDRDVSVRLLAQEGLARGGAEVVPQLAEALGAKTARTRIGAARALGLIGPPAGKALAALEALKKDGDAAIRTAAAEAAARVGPGRRP